MKKRFVSLCACIAFIFVLLPSDLVNAATGNDISNAAWNYIGISRDYYDCSAYVQKVYADCGISIPRSSFKQADCGSRIYSRNISDFQPGDIICFGSSSDSSSISHVGIYVGNDIVLHSSYTKWQIAQDSLTSWMNSSAYTPPYQFAVRVINDGEAPNNITIKADQTEIGVGDTINFTYTINNATSKYIGIDLAGGSRYYSIPLSNSSGSVSYKFTEPGTYCVITEGSNAQGYNCCNGIYISVSSTSPSNITIKANQTSIGVGDTVNFTYNINNATSKYIGIDWAGGNRYYSIPLSNSSGSVSYKFTEPGTYCVITEGSNAQGYNCCNGIYISVSSTSPSNITIKADKTEIIIGDTVKFTYTINNATSKYIGIDWAGGNRYYSIPLSNSSGSVSYKFTEPGTYCVITEGSNAQGYNCCNGIYITVKEFSSDLSTTTTVEKQASTYSIITEISNLNQSAVYIAAIYDDNDVLLENYIINLISGETAVSCNFNQYNNASYIKILLWNSLNEMNSLYKSEKIKL